jgi:hypothetical protein
MSFYKCPSKPNSASLFLFYRFSLFFTSYLPMSHRSGECLNSGSPDAAGRPPHVPAIGVTHPTMRAVFRTLRGNGPAATTADHGHRPPHLRGDGCLKSLGSESPLQFGFKGRPAPARTLAIGVTRPTLSLTIIESDSSRLGLGTTNIGPV